MGRVRSLFVESLRMAVPVLILAAGVGGLLVFGQRPEMPQRDEGGSQAALVETARVDVFDGTFVIDVQGTALPFSEVTVAAEVEGRVMHKSPDCRSGSYIQQGDVLLRIDDTDYTLELERLNAQLQQATEEVRAVEVDIASTQPLIALAEQELQLKERALARLKDIAGRLRSAVTEGDLDEGELQKLAARNTLQAVRNQLAKLTQQSKTLEAARDLVRVGIKQAEVNLARTKVTSPITGTVISDHVEQNDFVRVGDPLFTLNDTGRMEVKCSLRVDELYWVWAQARGSQQPAMDSAAARYELPPTPVQVVFELDDTEFVWDGTLSRYEGTGLDERTRTVPCRVVVDQPTAVRAAANESASSVIAPPSLLTGMYVTVRIPVDPPQRLLALPASALRPGGQVWLLRDDRLVIAGVEVARRRGDQVLVEDRPDSVQPQDKVVVSPLAVVQQGMALTEQRP